VIGLGPDADSLGRVDDGNDGGREKVYESQPLTRLFLRTGEIES